MDGHVATSFFHSGIFPHISQILFVANHHRHDEEDLGLFSSPRVDSTLASSMIFYTLLRVEKKVLGVDSFLKFLILQRAKSNYLILWFDNPTNYFAI